MLQIISIFLEFVIVILSLSLGLQKKKNYGYFFALTFGIYVIYDLAKDLNYAVDPFILQVLFFIATASALYAIWGLYNRK
jgi:hypothetical protein